MTGPKRVANDWYSPYFAPTTVLIAATVLFVSWEAGRYAGNMSVAHDRNALVPTAVTDTLPVMHLTPTKAAAHTPSVKASASTAGKSPH
jgi:hypothetical protein